MNRGGLRVGKKDRWLFFVGGLFFGSFFFFPALVKTQFVRQVVQVVLNL